jgi:16S rRNA (guanine966-N2)-methyltransferase
VEGLSVLDLFAGSGAMGLEALSRGAGSAVFVESDAAACATIRRNLKKLGLRGGRVVRDDALRALAAERARYGLVFVDPPYEMVESLLVPLATYLPPVLAEDALVVFETPARLEPELPLAKRTSRRYGAARLTVFEPA